MRIIPDTLWNNSDVSPIYYTSVVVLYRGVEYEGFLNEKGDWKIYTDSPFLESVYTNFKWRHIDKIKDKRLIKRRI